MNHGPYKRGALPILKVKAHNRSLRLFCSLPLVESNWQILNDKDQARADDNRHSLYTS
jgi:hypothetical protein